MRRGHSLLKSIACVFLVAVACWNIGRYTAIVLNLAPRDWNSPVGWEKAWAPIQNELTRYGYRIGDLGYVTAQSLRGGSLSDAESVSWAELQYTVIPFNLIANKTDAPFVIGNFTGGKPTELPPGLVEVYDPGNGLVLLKTGEIR